MKDYCRPLRIVHGDFGYTPEMAFGEKAACIRRRLTDLAEKGFGGIVTNVSFENYLQDGDEWRLMREKVNLCRELGLRMWLYDEKGYPSGTAGTLTLAKDPDFEARALAMDARVLAPGESWSAGLPRGHEKILAAVSYRMKGERITDGELAEPYRCYAPADPVKFENPTDGRLLCLLFCEKHMYEGAHCEHNVCACRRYIDVSNRDAVREFLENTYRRYSECVGDCCAAEIGDPGENAVVEAIFTDEPSYMGVYINEGLYPEKVDHPFDDTLPLLPVVNWGRDTANRFASLYGSRLEDQLTCLFFGHDERSCLVRNRYHALMSRLYEESFFAQISDYCARTGLHFSGHILLEDELGLHVMFEGNFFSLLRHMHYPGIDMLTSLPEGVWNYAFTPKLVGSIARLYGRPHVMDEVSGHAQGGKVTLRQIYVSLMLQYVFGADVFTSYYSDDYERDGQRRLLDAVSFAEHSMAGERLQDILLYYPIETMMRRRKPEHPFSELDDDAPRMMAACSGAMTKAQFALLNAQTDFCYIDTEALGLADAAEWKAFVIGACDVSPELLGRVRELSAKGVRVVYFCPEEEFLPEYEKLAPCGALLARDAASLLRAVKPEGPEWSGDTDGVAALRTPGRQLLVNRDDRPKTLRRSRRPARLLDVLTREAVPFSAENEDFSFTLAPSSAVLLEEPDA